MLVAAQDVVVNNNAASESDVSTYAGLTKVATGRFGENLEQNFKRRHVFWHHRFLLVIYF